MLTRDVSCNRRRSKKRKNQVCGVLASGRGGNQGDPPEIVRQKKKRIGQSLRSCFVSFLGAPSQRHAIQADDTISLLSAGIGLDGLVSVGMLRHPDGRQATIPMSSLEMPRGGLPVSPLYIPRGIPLPDLIFEQLTTEPPTNFLLLHICSHCTSTPISSPSNLHTWLPPSRSSGPSSPGRASMP
jgi:hypothetical protein